MNKLSTYISSLIVSVLFVLAILCSSAALLVNFNISSEKAIALTEEKNLGEVVQSELDKYYYKKYNSSGIPANVYALSNDYVKQCERECIKQGFYALEYGKNPEITIPKNIKLEESIAKFFNDYATKEGYKKDGNFTKKVEDTIDNAYSTIKSYCDVYKISALSEHKVLLRISSLYKYKNIMVSAAVAVDILLILLLFIINRKNRITVYYWAGISAFISGIAGVIPCAVLLLNKYYDSFSIKQPAVFLAYTGAMYKFTKAFMAVSAAIAFIGVCLIIIYAVRYSKYNHNEKTK